MILLYYYMAQVTSSKIARCDWLLTWRNFSVMTRALWKLLMPCEKKNLKILNKSFLKKKFPLKLNKILKWARKNFQTVNFIILKSKKRWRNASRRYEKLVPVVLIFVIKSATIYYSSTVRFLRKNIKPRPCCIDLAIAKSIQKGLGLIFYLHSRLIRS